MIDYQLDEYHQQRHPELLESRDLREAWSHFAELAYFRHVTQGQSVLEFGGGLGNNLLAVCRRADTWMVEPSKIGRETTLQAGIHVAATLEELGDRRFESVLCRHVLEHVDNPLATLVELRQRITNGGRLVLVVPCEDSHEAPVEQELDHHLYCWNPRTLTNLLQRAGYRAQRVGHESFGAKRKLMPLYRLMRGTTYAQAVRMVGRLFRFRELVVEARPA
jgi:ubiquinone/menaquinone biosynthesis C-methylase UbiE